VHHTFTDQLSRKISVSTVPKRIISLVPSQTELLFDLGLDDRIVGVTKFCNHPADKVRNKVKVGGTKKLNIDLIRSLNPDLIIGNKEENERLQIEALMQEFPVWMSDITHLPSAINMVTRIGELTNTVTRANVIAKRVEAGFETLLPMKRCLRAAYLIWQQPYMASGKDTFIDDMLQRCGFINVFEQQRYPQLVEADLQQAQPDVIMLSSEPYPFKQKHIRAFEAMLPEAKVILVDGEMFSWYGSRLIHALAYFKQLINGFD
jgi:ABC-type Fe3+-hydroxamate transport system substrate-binding protein